MKEYQDPKGYQIVRRSLEDEELLVVHTFEGGANPPIERLLEGREVIEAFGSELDGDFRGRVMHVNKYQ